MFYLFFLLNLTPGVTRWAMRRREPAGDPGPGDDPPGPDLPLPRPGQLGGAVGFLLRYHLSSLLALANPGHVRQVLAQARGQTRALERIGGALPDPDTFRQKVVYTLPVEGVWLVMNGGVTERDSHSWEIVSQRFAFDCAVADDAGCRHRGDGTRVEDYLAYGRPIVAVADGEVAGVVDGIRDAPAVGTGWIDWRAPAIAGNSVTIRHAEGEYSFSAHLAPGSIRVRVGDRVRRGEWIGACGHSGLSTEPHLHFQVQDHPDFFEAVGLPVRFSSVMVNGIPAPAPVHLRGGIRVSPTSAPPSPSSPPRTPGSELA